MIFTELMDDERRSTKTYIDILIFNEGHDSLEVRSTSISGIRLAKVMNMTYHLKKIFSLRLMGVRGLVMTH